MEEELSLNEILTLPNYIPLNVPYNQPLKEYIDKTPYIHLYKVIRSNIAIVYVDENKLKEAFDRLGNNRIYLLPSVMTTLGRTELEASGIIQIQEQPYLDLKGQGVLIGIIDTGIDYTSGSFKYEDGTSKIKYIWDQTIEGNAPEGYHFGSEYTNEQINEALSSPNPYEKVPHIDEDGHGTFIAAEAAGKEDSDHIGAAPEAELIVVKLKEAKGYLRERYTVPKDAKNVFMSTSVMIGIEYMLDKAQELRMPISICISTGTNISGHDSFDILEDYLSAISVQDSVCVCTAAGNESHAKHHTNGKIDKDKGNVDIEIKVPVNAESFQVYIWNNPQDKFSVSMKTPTGELINRIPARPGKAYETNLVFEKSKVKVEYYFPMIGSGSEYILITITNPTPGIWTITLHGDILFDGTYHAWLPITGLISKGIEFLNPTPNCTIVVPATTVGSITVGGYNNRDGSLYINSSWGPTRTPVISPDLVAPGVSVAGIYPDGPGVMSGTSVATAIATGACALMMQWGIVQGNDISLNTYVIRSFLIRGCIRDPNIEYPSVQWGYGKINLLNTFNQIRSK